MFYWECEISSWFFQDKFKARRADAAKGKSKASPPRSIRTVYLLERFLLKKKQAVHDCGARAEADAPMAGLWLLAQVESCCSREGKGALPAKVPMLACGLGRCRKGSARCWLWVCCRLAVDLNPAQHIWSRSWCKSRPKSPDYSPPHTRAKQSAAQR